MFEVIGSGSEPQLQIRKKDVIDRIEDKDDEMMAEVERVIAKQRAEHEHGQD